MEHRFYRRIAVSALLLAALFLAACGASPSVPETETVSPPPAPEPLSAVVISELMPSNRAAVELDGAFPDWLELANTGEESVSLLGCALRCGNRGIRLGDLTLAPGEALLVPCRDMSLPKEGAKVHLCAPDGTVLDRVEYRDAPEDESLIRSGDDLLPCKWPSPGQPNDFAGYVACQQTRIGGELLLNEAMVYNAWYLGAQEHEARDWIELKNNGDSPLDLSGWSVSDKASEQGRYLLPEQTLSPGDLITLFCGTEDAALPFGLSSDRDELFLWRPDGSLCDYVSLHDIPIGASMGRMPGEGGFFYFLAPSPGAENAGGVRGVSEQPHALTPAGIYGETKSLTVKLEAPGEIYYAFGGSVPTEESARYTGPLTVEKTAVLRAVCIQPDMLPSESLDLSYLLNEGHGLPVVSVIAEPDDLFSQDAGIYSNPEKNWEKTVSAALFAEDRGFGPMRCGLKMHGAKSRVNQAKKSFKLCFRDRYDGLLNCDLFENGVTEFDSVLLRAAWESTVSTQMRDVLMHELAANCSDSLPVQGYRYCALYLNGEYWGLYALREAHSEDHYARHFGLDPESVIMSQGDWGRGELAREIWDFLVTHDMRDNENYAWIAGRLDMESVVTWAIIESYSGNIDMNSPNMRFYESSEDGKMRYALVDLDLGFFDFGEANQAMRTGNPYSKAIVYLMENPDFRSLYLQRLSEYLHGPLSDENFLRLVEKLSDETRSEAPRDYARWKKDFRDWQHEIDMYLIGSTRYPDGHAGRIADSAKNVFRLTDAEWETWFADLISKKS